MSSIHELDSHFSQDKLLRRLSTHMNRHDERTLILIISPLEGNILHEMCGMLKKKLQIVSVSFNAQHNQEYAQGKHLQNFTLVPLLYGHKIEPTLFQSIQEHYIQKVAVVYYSQEAYQYKEEAESLAYKCEVEIKQHWVNHATQVRFGTSWYKNIWKNLSQHYKFAIPDLSYHYHKEKKTAIIIGAGPSLTKEKLDFIHAYRHKLVIFAVDTALPILQKYDIIPQFCILLESQYYNMKDLIPLPHNNIIALGDLCCYPSSLRAFSDAVCVSTKFSPVSFFNTYQSYLPPSIPPLGSVGLMAVYLAIHTQPSYLFMIGLDFSFYRGLSHASYAPPYLHWMSTQSRTEPWKYANAHFNNAHITSIGGKRVHDPILETYRKKMERSILPLATQYNIQCMDLNDESIIASIPHCSITHATHIMEGTTSHDNSFVWRNSLEIGADTEFYTSLESVPHTNNTFSTLATKEQQNIALLSRRIQELMKNKEIPTEKDWRDGLDNYSIILSEDPYAVKYQQEIWEQNNIYTRLYIIMQHINQVIEMIK